MSCVCNLNDLKNILKGLATNIYICRYSEFNSLNIKHCLFCEVKLKFMEI